MTQRREARTTCCKCCRTERGGLRRTRMLARVWAGLRLAGWVVRWGGVWCVARCDGAEPECWCRFSGRAATAQSTSRVQRWIEGIVVRVGSLRLGEVGSRRMREGGRTGGGWWGGCGKVGPGRDRHGGCTPHPGSSQFEWGDTTPCEHYSSTCGCTLRILQDDSAPLHFGCGASVLG